MAFVTFECRKCMVITRLERPDGAAPDTCPHCSGPVEVLSTEAFSARLREVSVPRCPLCNARVAALYPCDACGAKMCTDCACPKCDAERALSNPRRVE